MFTHRKPDPAGKERMEEIKARSGKVFPRQFDESIFEYEGCDIIMKTHKIPPDYYKDDTIVAPNRN